MTKVGFRKSKAATAALLLGCIGSVASAYAVYGAIGEKYTALGREGGALGPPTSDESPAPNGGRFNSFRNGFIYWHPETGAYAVWGLIGQKWDQLGRVAYGYPITDELPTPDGRGRFNHFRAIQLPGKPESSIYWTPQTGAHAIYGEIRKYWSSMGWERSWLGYPIGDEVQDGDFRRNAFENGFIRWSAGTGSQAIRTGRTPQTGGGFALIPVDGLRAVAELPPSNQQVMLYEDPFAFAPAELCARFMNRPGLDATIRDTLIARVRGRLPGGFGIHSQTNHRLGSSCTARADFVQRTVWITIVVPQNRLFVRITTPDGFPGGLDPNFAMTYDLTLQTSMTFPTTVAGSVAQGPVTVRAINVSQPQSRSITGNLGILLNDISSFLGGPDFIAAMRQGGVSTLPGIDTGVNALNVKLAQLRAAAPPGTRLDTYQQDNQVVLLATNRPPPRGPN